MADQVSKTNKVYTRAKTIPAASQTSAVPGILDQRPKAVAQRKLFNAVAASPQVRRLRALSVLANESIRMLQQRTSLDITDTAASAAHPSLVTGAPPIQMVEKLTLNAESNLTLSEMIEIAEKDILPWLQLAFYDNSCTDDLARIYKNFNNGLEYYRDLLGNTTPAHQLQLSLLINSTIRQVHENMDRKAKGQEQIPASAATSSSSSAGPRVQVPKTEYIGGKANDSHIHQYGSGFHLKLGGKRYNIVKNEKFYAESFEMAIQALRAITGERQQWAATMIEYLNEMAAPYQ